MHEQVARQTAMKDDKNESNDTETDILLRDSISLLCDPLYSLYHIVYMIIF